MTSAGIDTERHEYHGWPIRLTCEFQVTQGMFAAHSYVTPGGQRERQTPCTAVLEPSSSDAKAGALKAAKHYIDSILVD